MNDTHPRMEAVLVAGYRAMSVSQKLARVTSLTRTVQELALLDIRRRHSDADQRELALRLASRWLDADLMKRAFTLLHKLVWFRLGNEISDRQWTGVLGVLKIQGAERAGPGRFTLQSLS
jgi:hypothetical protein